MADDRVLADARRFFRREVDDSWGYLVRKRKERTPREETIAEARRIYWNGIKRAWRIYTKDNEIAKRADAALDKAIHEAYERVFKVEEEMSDEAYDAANKLYVRMICQLHDDYAEKVAGIWKAFTKDMKKKQR